MLKLLLLCAMLATWADAQVRTHRIYVRYIPGVAGQTGMETSALLGAFVDSIRVSGDTLYVLQQRSDETDTTLTIGPEVVDVTGVGPPPAGSGTLSSVFVDAEIPRLWFTRVQTVGVAADAMGNFSTYANSNYLGAFDVLPQTGTENQFVYRPNLHIWQRLETFGNPAVLGWFQRTAAEVLGSDVDWLGDAHTDAEALARIADFNTARRYIFYNQTLGSVRRLVNSSYSAPTQPRDVYTYVTLPSDHGFAHVDSVRESVGDTVRVYESHADGTDTTVVIAPDVVNVTGRGPPQASEHTVDQVFVDAEIPRLWFTRKETVGGTAAAGTFANYTATHYRGAQQGYPSNPVEDDFFYRTDFHHWYLRITTRLLTGEWHQRTAQTVLGSDVDWLGDATNAAAALARIADFNTNRRYIFYNETGGTVQVLDNSTYTAPTNPLDVYSYITLPGASGGTGLTAGDIEDFAEIASPAATIPTGRIADNAITSAKIATDAVNSSEIAADAVGAPEIAAGAVGSSELANNAATASKIPDEIQIPTAFSGSAGQVAKINAGGTAWELGTDNEGIPASRLADSTAAVRSYAGSAFHSAGFNNGTRNFTLGRLNGTAPASINLTYLNAFHGVETTDRTVTFRPGDGVTWQGVLYYYSSNVSASVLLSTIPSDARFVNISTGSGLTAVDVEDFAEVDSTTATIPTGRLADGAVTSAKLAADAATAAKIPDAIELPDATAGTPGLVAKVNATATGWVLGSDLVGTPGSGITAAEYAVKTEDFAEVDSTTATIPTGRIADDAVTEAKLGAVVTRRLPPDPQGVANGRIITALGGDWATAEFNFDVHSATAIATQDGDTLQFSTNPPITATSLGFGTAVIFQTPVDLAATGGGAYLKIGAMTSYQLRLPGDPPVAFDLETLNDQAMYLAVYNGTYYVLTDAGGLDLSGYAAKTEDFAEVDSTNARLPLSRLPVGVGHVFEVLNANIEIPQADSIYLNPPHGQQEEVGDLYLFQYAPSSEPPNNDDEVWVRVNGSPATGLKLLSDNLSSLDDVVLRDMIRYRIYLIYRAGTFWHIMGQTQPDDRIATNELYDAAVTNTKIANDAVTSAKIDDGQVFRSDIGTGAVGALQIDDDAVGTGELQTGAVNSIDMATGVRVPDAATGQAGQVMKINASRTGWELGSDQGGDVSTAQLADSTSAVRSALSDTAAAVRSDAGDITGVHGGAGLSGSANSGDVTLNVIYSTADPQDVTDSPDDGSGDPVARANHRHRLAANIRLPSASSGSDGQVAKIQGNTWVVGNDQVGQTGSGITEQQYAARTEDFAEVDSTSARIPTFRIADDAITNAKIADDAVRSDQIGDNAVRSNHILDGQVETADLDDAAVTRAKIAIDAVGSAEIDALAVTSAELAANAVGVINIQANAVTADKIHADVRLPNATTGSNGQVAKIQGNAWVVGDDLTGAGGGGLTVSQLAAKVENFAEVDSTSARIPTVRYADRSVTGAKIAASTVTETNMAPGSINTAEIIDLAVTEAKLATNSVTAIKIAANAVTGSEIADDAVGTDQLANNAVGTAQVANAAVTGPKMATAVRLPDANTGNLGQVAKINGSGGWELGHDNVISGNDLSGLVRDFAIVGNSAQVGTDRITNSAITGPKIAAGAVRTADIADDAVTAPKIPDDIQLPSATGATDGQVAVVSSGGWALGTGGGGGGLALADYAAKTEDYAEVDSTSARVPIGRLPVGMGRIFEVLNANIEIPQADSIYLNPPHGNAEEVGDVYLFQYDPGSDPPDNGDEVWVRVNGSPAIRLKLLADDLTSLENVELRDMIRYRIYLIYRAGSFWHILGQTQSNDMVATNELLDGAVTNPKIADSAVNGAKIATDAVGHEELAANSVRGSEIADDAVGQTELANNAILAQHIGSNQIEHRHLTNDIIETPELADNAVTGQKIAANSVGSSDIVDGMVLEADLGNGAVTAVKISGNSVVTSKIADGAVTNPKIADNAVNSSKLASGAVASVDLANGAVTSAKVAASLSLTGDPQAPDPPSGDNDQSIATTAWVTAAISGGTVTPTTHTRYAVLTETNTQPTAAEFQAGATAESNTIEVPAFTANRYLWFADIYDDLTDIREEGSAFNSRTSFSATPASLDIGGTTHYAYGSLIQFLPNPNATNWVLNR